MIKKYIEMSELKKYVWHIDTKNEYWEKNKNLNNLIIKISKIAPPKNNFPYKKFLEKNVEKLCIEIKKQDFIDITVYKKKKSRRNNYSLDPNYINLLKNVENHIIEYLGKYIGNPNLIKREKYIDHCPSKDEKLTLNVKI